MMHERPVHPLTKKRVEREEMVRSQVVALGANYIPKQLWRSNEVQRKIDLIKQDIKFLVEAAIEEGIESDKHLANEELKVQPRPDKTVKEYAIEYLRPDGWWEAGRGWYSVADAEEDAIEHLPNHVQWRVVEAPEKPRKAHVENQ